MYIINSFLKAEITFPVNFQFVPARTEPIKRSYPCQILHIFKSLCEMVNAHLQWYRSPWKLPLIYCGIFHICEPYWCERFFS